MRNFTLGKKGFSRLLFALILFSGTYSSYGQCPLVDAADSTQYFCDSQEAEVGDLTVSDPNGATVTWYDDQTTTTPIPATTFLVNGKTYYAGSSDGSCVNNRATVTVSIASGPEILGIRSSDAIVTSAQRKQSLTVIGICVADVNDPNVFIEDLRTNVESPNEVRWYYNRTSTDAIPADTELQNNTDYFAALVLVVDGVEICETNRTKTTVKFYSEAAPTGPANQDFCAIDNPTLADIEASGDNRYFSTATSQTELSPNTPLEDDKTYYISAVGENCESTERLKVTVNVIPAADLGEPQQGIVCELDVSETFPSEDAIRNYYLSLLPEGTPTDGTLSPTANQIATAYQNDEDGLGDFTTTYTVGCDTVDLTVTIIPAEQANAGDDVTLNFTLNDGEQNLHSYLTSGAQTIGTFEGYPNGTFDPSAEGEGTYTVTYTVDETSGCITGSDSAIFTINVAPCDDNAGANVDADLCKSEAEALAAQFSAATSEEERDAILAEFLGERDTDGSFTGDPATELAQKYQAGIYPFTVSTTYVVGTGVCEDEAAISLTVYQDVNAGNSTSITLNPDDSPVNLFELLGENADAGGTWNMGNGVFDPATDAPGTYTYTVGEGCTDSADVVVTVSNDPTDPGFSSGSGVVCQADVDTFFPSYDEIRKYYLGLLPSGVDTNGTFNPTPKQISEMYQADEDGLGAFTTTYTVTDGESSQSYELTVYIVTEAEAGENNTVTLTTEDEPVNLFTYLGEDALPSGTWSSGNGIFDPATDEAGTFTYTVGYEGCMDSATITVVVNEPTEPCDIAGTPGYSVVCLANVDETFPSIDEIRKYYLSLLDAGVPTNGTLNPTAAQISAAYQADEDGLGEFTTTYTVTVGECTDSVQLTVLIANEADAGEDAQISLDENDAPVDLFAELGGTPQMGGTWNPGNGIFDPATDEPGVYTYTVGSGDCMDSATVTVSVTTDPCEGVVDAGTDSSATVCETDVDTTFPSVDEIRKFYLDLLDPGVSRDGTLNPTAAQISQMYQNDEDGLGDFTTTYTLTSGDCSDSVELTVSIIPLEEANAGTIAPFTVCVSDNPVDLFSYLSDDASAGGRFFDNSGNEIVNGAFDASQEGEFVLTYTVSDDFSEACVTGSDSTTFTVTVGENTANAGADNSVEVCNSDVENLSNAGVKNLYLGLLETGVPTNGTFNPTIQQIIDQYNINSKFGDFTTTYTVTNGECQDSAALTVTVLENPNAGQDATVNLEEGATATVDLFDALGGTPDAGGVWTDSDGTVVDATFDPATESEGVYTYTVTGDNGCSDSATVTIVIGVDPTLCPEITEATQTFCIGATVADLSPATAVWYTSADATTALTVDTALVDGTQYFAGNAEGTCTTRGVVTVVIEDAPAAPTVTDFTGCVVENATVADLDITAADGNTVQVFTDQELNTPAADDDVLTEGTYYVTQTSAAGCQSPAAEINVTLADSDAPTLSTGGNVFCEFDNATLADLEENVSANGDITWYATATGTDPLGGSTVLVNGTTYYATSTGGDSGCESSERLPVTVTLEVCEIVIPEAFSPNGDGINDRFEIDNLTSEYPNFNLEIYNRWGEPVYKGNSSTPTWDGTSTEGSFGSGVLPAGVYFYILYYNDGQTAPTQGRLYLSR